VHYGWNLAIYKNADGQAAATTKKITSQGTVEISDATKGTYYVKVSSGSTGSSYSPIDCEYTITAKYTASSSSSSSSSSNGSSSSKLSKVTLKSATAGKKQVKLSWKKVSGATGYYVYRSTSKSGKYTKIATIKKGSTVTYTNKNLKSKQTYYYKVIAYKTANGKTTTGTASAVKSAKTK
jgi:hypothetical protein